MFHDAQLKSAKVAILGDRETARGVEAMFRRAGYLDVEVGSFDEWAAERVKSWNTDLLILCMPNSEADCCEILSRFNPQAEEMQNVPVFVISVAGKPFWGVRAMTSGAVVILEQPVDPVELLLQSRNHLEHRLRLAHLEREHELAIALE